MIKTPHRSARPEAEDLRQGEGRNVLALLGPVRPRLQDGNPPRAYPLAKKNNGAPGIDGVTFEAIETAGVEPSSSRSGTNWQHTRIVRMRNRRQEIPKEGAKVRVSGIPAIRDRVVQGALKLILEPIFEADFQAGSFGYRPKRTAHEAVQRVAEAIVKCKTRIIDIDLRAYFDNVRHDLLSGEGGRSGRAMPTCWACSR